MQRRIAFASGCCMSGVKKAKAKVPKVSLVRRGGMWYI
jgi:hypothetical protein